MGELFYIFDDICFLKFIVWRDFYVVYYLVYWLCDFSFSFFVWGLNKGKWLVEKECLLKLLSMKLKF